MKVDAGVVPVIEKQPLTSMLTDRHIPFASLRATRTGSDRGRRRHSGGRVVEEIST
jgi:hypothetical protein